MKAVVLETRGKRAAVLANDGTVRVARGQYSVGDIIDYNETYRPGLRQWAAAAAAMVILLGASAGMWVDRNYVAYAEVSLDVNPSIVYTLNKRDRVLGVRAANADAEAIVERLEEEDIRFAALSDAVEQTMALLDDAGYLDAAQEDYVLLNVSADDGARQTRLTEQVETAMTHTREQDATLEYRVDHSDRKTARQARDSGMSTGRYAAWQASENAGESAEKPGREDYERKPVRELLGHEPEKQDAPGETRDAPEANRDAHEEAREIPEGKQAASEAEAQAPESRQEPPELTQEKPEATQGEPEVKRDDPEVKRDAPGETRDAPEERREKTVAEPDGPKAEREAAEGKQEVPKAAREAPGAKQDKPQDKSSGDKPSSGKTEKSASGGSRGDSSPGRKAGGHDSGSRGGGHDAPGGGDKPGPM